MSSFAAFVRRINLRYWSRHRLRTALTAFGVVTGVTLVVAIAVINSTLLSTMQDTATSMAGDADIEVASPDSTGVDDRLSGRLADVDGVKAAVPVLRTYSTLRAGDGGQRVLVVGTTLDFHWLFAEAAEDGALDISGRLMSKNGILLAQETADKLGLRIGDRLTADTPNGTSQLVLGGTFSGQVVEKLETGDLAMMALHTAQDIFDRADRVHSVYVVAEDGADVRAIEDRVAKITGPAAIVGPPGERVRGFEETLSGIAAITSLAGTVALFVSAFVVFNTMAMSIVERRREISLTLALGATRKQVMAGFVGEAAVLGAVACAIGVTAGFFLAKVMVQPGLDGLRVFSITAVAGAQLSWGHVLLGLIAGVGVSTAGAYLPARRILNVAPVEALRPHAAYQVSETPRPSALRTVLIWLVGIGLMAPAVILGPVLSQNMENATWAANAGLVLLLLGVTVMLPSVVRFALWLFRATIGRFVGIHGRLAITSLVRNASRTTVTVGALAFTFGTVISAGGALDSYRAEWGRAARTWYAGTIQVASPSFVSLGSDQPLPVTFARTLQETEGVRGVYPARYRIVNVEGRQTTIYIMGYDQQMSDPGVPRFGDEKRDRIGSVLRERKIVISKLSAMKKEIGVGDELAVPTPTGIARFEVGGIVNDLNPLDSMYLSNEMFLEHWRASGVDRFEVTIEDGFARSEVIAAIESAAERDGVPVNVDTREDFVAETFGPIDQVFSVARAVQLVALIVAALALANTMFITVIERRWELGLQRAMGMDGGSVTRTLLAEAGMMTVIGGLGSWVVGVICGALMVQDMERSYAMSFPFELPVGLMALTLIVGGLIALVAGAYPSRTAVRTPIVEALRFE